MSSYTMELRTIIEQASQYEPGLTLKERIEKGRKQLFDFQYEFFDDSLRAEFETHFIQNFYMREIGFETEALFKMRLENWLHLNMPYWNEMFKSEGLIKDPLINVDWIRKLDRETGATAQSKQTGKQDVSSQETVNGTNTNTNQSFNRDIRADTPDSRLNLTTNDSSGILEYASEINESSHKDTQNNTASNTTKGSSNSSHTNDSDVKSEEDVSEVEHTRGTMGMKTEAEMLDLYRGILLRIERDIFREMNCLFMLVY